MSRTTPAIPEECWECVLPDCYPEHPRCHLLIKDALAKGKPLPEDRELPTGKTGRPKKIRPVVAVKPKPAPKPPPAPVKKHKPRKKRTEYQKKYENEAAYRRRRIILRGVKIRRCDIEALQEHYSRLGSSFAQEVIDWVERRAKEVGAFGL